MIGVFLQHPERETGDCTMYRSSIYVAFCIVRDTATPQAVRTLTAQLYERRAAVLRDPRPKVYLSAEMPKAWSNATM